MDIIKRGKKYIMFPVLYGEILAYRHLVNVDQYYLMWDMLSWQPKVPYQDSCHGEAMCVCPMCQCIAFI